LRAESLLGAEESPPHGRIAEDEDSELVGGFRSSRDLVRGKHRVEIEEGEVVRFGGILAKRQARTAGEEGVVRGKFSEIWERKRDQKDYNQIKE
jgi:hypothetical protein